MKVTKLFPFPKQNPSGLAKLYLTLLGLSTLTNISRYDLPDPDTYKDFLNVHPLYDFQTLQSTCSFLKGCPLNKLDISIAYDLPEILTGI